MVRCWLLVGCPFCGALFVIVCGVGVLLAVACYVLLVAIRCCCALCVLRCLLVALLSHVDHVCSLVNMCCVSYAGAGVCLCWLDL